MACETLPQSEGVEYRIIEGYADYAVGDDGSVWSKRGRRGWKEMRPCLDRDGYCHIHIVSECGTNLHTTVHKLVLVAFVGEAPFGKEARHFPDRTRSNNRLANLQWGTPKENSADKLVHGTNVCGTLHHHCKLDESKVVEIRERYATGVTQKTLATIYGVPQTTISGIVRGKSWKHICGPISVENQDPKLNEENVRDIRRRAKNGETHRLLARMFSVSSTTIHKIIHREKWKHVA